MCIRDRLKGSDVFLGLSAAGILKPEMLVSMAAQPIVFALANPTPEIMPELAREVRPDVIMATGRSDYPNQVNNVLCFPFIFRGALDVGATGINEQMKMACVKALAAMAQEEVSAEEMCIRDRAQCERVRGSGSGLSQLAIHDAGVMRPAP